ncbi:MAG: tetratricopeptide repeat protein [Thermoanaerobaculia bacterium]
MAQTFHQSVALFKEGRADEVRAGCELIIKMDPHFAPAKRLLEKLSNPMAQIDVDALLASVDPGESGAVAEARSALEARDFRRVTELCSSILGSDPTNAAAQELGSAASEKLEAEPFVLQFVDKARNEIAAGRLDAANAAIDKARSLDEDHPAVKATLASWAAAQAGGNVIPSFDAAAGAFDAPAEPEAASPGGFDFSSAFVVDSPPPEPAPAAPSASGTPAADFGFTFEEEQKAAAAEPEPEPFDTPFAAPVDSGGPAEFDFTTAAVDLSPDDASKIKQYLSEGDAAYGQQDFQKAIDLWSRIFLIDVTNDEASQRIELARKKRLEVDQQIDDLVVAGTLAFEKRDFGSARERFEEVLRLDPTHFNASEYLEKLNDAQSGVAISEPARPPHPATVAPLDDLYDDYQSNEESGTPGDEDAFAAPTTGRVRTAPAPSAKPKKGIPKVAIIGGLIALLAVLAAGGWFMFGPKGPKFDPALTQKELDRAVNFASLGEYDRAIEVLKAIDSTDPMHNRALELIADFQAQKSQARDKAAQVDYQARLTKAREAFAIKNYLEAKSQYESASAIKPLPPEDQANYQIAGQQAAKLDAAQVLFKEGRYVESIGALEQLLAEDPENVSVRLLMAGAHFNLGRSLLETEQLGQAAEQFGKALEYNAQDELAQRARDFAVRYDDKPKDLLYRIFVKYLPLR